MRFLVITPTHQMFEHYVSEVQRILPLPRVSFVFISNEHMLRGCERETPCIWYGPYTVQTARLALEAQSRYIVTRIERI